MSYSIRSSDVDSNVDEIQIISEKVFDNPDRTRNSLPTAEPVSCGVCSLNLDKFTLLQRGEHYEWHFHNDLQSDSLCPRRPHPSDTRPLKTASNPDIKSSNSSNKMMWNKNRIIKEKDIFWYPALSTSPPSSCTPGLIPLMKKLFLKNHAEGATRRAVLCHAKSVHVRRELWDAGWGCGYRNFLMACAALMEQSLQPLYFPLLDAPIEPGIMNLQMWIENAWKAGFDAEGAKELKHLVGTSKQIGTSDLWVAFSSRGIPAELVDFNSKSRTLGVEAVTNWVVDYFSPKVTLDDVDNAYDVLRGASPVAVTDRMPIILQHNGHSRMIVGYEVSKNGTINLLTFDPAYTPSKRVRNAAISYSIAPSQQHQSLGSFELSPLQPSARSYHHSTENTRKLQKRPIYGSSCTPCPDSAAKRARFSPLDEPVDEEDGVIMIKDCRGQLPRKHAENSTDKDKEHAVTELSPRRLLAHFRLDPKKLEKNKGYQILYFPMTAPLTDDEKMSKKVVTSTEII